MDSKIEVIFATLASNVARMRKAKGLTQAKLAEEAGLSLTGLQRLEARERWPRPSTVTSLAAALGIQPYELFLPANATATRMPLGSFGPDHEADYPKDHPTGGHPELQELLAHLSPSERSMLIELLMSLLESRSA